MHREIQSVPLAPTRNGSATPSDFEFAALNSAHNYRRAIYHEFASALVGNVLEAGSGVGHMTELLHHRKEVSRLVCLEPNADFCQLHRQKFPGVELVEGTSQRLSPNESWDAILSVNVLEHIADDRAELARYAGLLSPRHGRLCILVPARPEIYAPIDRDFGHFRRYTKRELRSKLKDAGFEVEKLSYFNFVGYFAWWLSFCALKRRSFNVAQVKLFDQLIFPMTHWLESKVLRPPLGQSLIAIAAAA